ncbi:MAG: DUF1049 domain-containing protein [Desulfovibrionaceae bacterium]|nr:DUF1049 domain-containing protein [Desulfovibrionaceae bacterium]
MRFIKFFLQLLIFMIVLLFFVENSVILSQTIQFQMDLFIPDYIWLLPPLPLYGIVLIVFAMGVMAAVFHFTWGRWCSAIALREARATIRTLEKEIAAHRQLALKTEELTGERNQVQTDSE